jgi:hypothetical protein
MWCEALETAAAIALHLKKMSLISHKSMVGCVKAGRQVTKDIAQADEDNCLFVCTAAGRIMTIWLWKVMRYQYHKYLEPIVS